MRLPYRSIPRRKILPDNQRENNARSVMRVMVNAICQAGTGVKTARNGSAMGAVRGKRLKPTEMGPLGFIMIEDTNHRGAVTGMVNQLAICCASRLSVAVAPTAPMAAEIITNAGNRVAAISRRYEVSSLGACPIGKNEGAIRRAMITKRIHTAS